MRRNNVIKVAVILMIALGMLHVGIASGFSERQKKCEDLCYDFYSELGDERAVFCTGACMECSKTQDYSNCSSRCRREFDYLNDSKISCLKGCSFGIKVLSDLE
jgi:hypothetical protein